MKPDLTGRVQERQALQKKYHDRNTKERKFNVGDQVFIREFPNGQDWLPVSVFEVRGPLTYVVMLADGRCVRRHVEHVRVRTSETDSVAQDRDEGIHPLEVSTPDEDSPPPTPNPDPPTLQRSGRTRAPPTITTVNFDVLNLRGRSVVDLQTPAANIVYSFLFRAL